MIRLNLGAGDTQIDGFTPVDIKAGGDVRCLQYADNSVDEVRASHVLEHIPFPETGKVLAEWVRVLKPGGWLRVAVPNLDYILQNCYINGADPMFEGYLMGGHTDPDDAHAAVFNEQKLTALLQQAGLEEIQPWRSEIQDCASLPVSLNLKGRKPTGEEKRPLKISAVMSTPRLGFMDNFFCAFGALAHRRIPIRRHTGAFWGQCLTRAIEEALTHDLPDAILTIDYDTVFTGAHLETLIKLMEDNPHVDAVAPIQSSRGKKTILTTIRGENGKPIAQISRETMMGDLVRAATAHFGLTLIRVSALRKMSVPWFWSKPTDDGRWYDDRSKVDDDIWFWKQWEAAGNSLYLAPRVAVGHAEQMIIWPDKTMQAMYQHPSEFWDSGAPEGVWK